MSLLKLKADFSTDLTYFEDLYRHEADPFRNWPNPYEDFKRMEALKVLRGRSFRRVYEPGCGNGALSYDLSGLTQELVSTDWSLHALEAAKSHCRSRKNIRFEQLKFPDDHPRGSFDLIVISELLYYLSAHERRNFYGSLLNLLSNDGLVLFVHWRGRSEIYPSCGDEVHEEIQTHSELFILEDQTFEEFRITLGSWS